MIQLMKYAFFNEEETRKKLSKFILSNKRLSMGENCFNFEKKFSDYQGRNYSVFVNSGSSANLALIQALLNLGKIKKGDKVGFSSVTWSTNVMPLIQLGLDPIAIDVSKENLNVDIENLKSLKENIKVLFLTNLLGFSGKIDKIRDYCDEKNIILLEDNCESLGSVVNGKKLGNFGLASTFSFFVGHHLSTIEGGMICTDDKELYEMLLMVRAHGWTREVGKEKSESLKKDYLISEFYNKYTFYYLGFNIRPTEINGFLGLEQLDYIEELHKRRSKNFEIFQNAAKNNPDFLKLDLKHMDFISNFAYPIVCKNKQLFEKYLSKFVDVEVRPIVGGSMNEQPFFGGKKINCPNAKEIHTCGFYIPNNPDLTDKEIEFMSNIIRGL